ncbi:hypothetical protein HQ563_11600 [bacterium]|nr:hypothetical protein [bacterium]
MKRKRIIALLSLMAIVGLAFAVALSVQGKPGSSSERFKPCGVYVGIQGDPAVYVMTIIPDDPSGNTFTAIIEYAEAADNTFFGEFPEADTITCHYLRAVRTGKYTYDFTGVLYATDTDNVFMGKLVYICVASGEMSFSEDGSIMSWSGPLEYYSADQDQNGDKFPDDGEVPYPVFPGVSQAKRL